MTLEDRTLTRRDFTAVLQYIDTGREASSPAGLAELNATEASLSFHFDDAVGEERPSDATLDAIRLGTIVTVRVGGEALTCRVDRLLSGRLEATLLSMPVSPVNRATWIVGDGLVFLKQHVVTVHA